MSDKNVLDNKTIKNIINFNPSKYFNSDFTLIKLFYKYVKDYDKSLFFINGNEKKIFENILSIDDKNLKVKIRRNFNVLGDMIISEYETESIIEVMKNAQNNKLLKDFKKYYINKYCEEIIKENRLYVEDEVNDLIYASVEEYDVDAFEILFKTFPNTNINKVKSTRSALNRAIYRNKNKIIDIVKKYNEFHLYNPEYILINMELSKYVNNKKMINYYNNLDIKINETSKINEDESLENLEKLIKNIENEITKIDNRNLMIKKNDYEILNKYLDKAKKEKEFNNDLINTIIKILPNNYNKISYPILDNNIEAENFKNDIDDFINKFSDYLSLNDNKMVINYKFFLDSRLCKNMYKKIINKKDFTEYNKLMITNKISVNDLFLCMKINKEFSISFDELEKEKELLNNNITKILSDKMFKVFEKYSDNILDIITYDLSDYIHPKTEALLLKRKTIIDKNLLNNYYKNIINTDRKKEFLFKIIQRKVNKTKYNVKNNFQDDIGKIILNEFKEFNIDLLKMLNKKSILLHIIENHYFDQSITLDYLSNIKTKNELKNFIFELVESLSLTSYYESKETIIIKKDILTEYKDIFEIEDYKNEIIFVNLYIYEVLEEDEFCNIIATFNDEDKINILKRILVHDSKNILNMNTLNKRNNELKVLEEKIVLKNMINENVSNISSTKRKL